MKRWSNAIAVLVILAIAFYYFTHTKIEPPAPPAGSPSSITIPVEVSQLALPVHFETQKLRDLIDQAITAKTFNGSADGDFKIGYNFNIGSVKLSSDPSAKRIVFTLPFSGHVQVEKKVLFIKVSVGSDGNGHATISASPAFKDDWSIDPKADFAVSIPTWNVHTSLGDIGVAGIVERLASAALENNRSKIEAAIKKELQLHDKVEQLWKKVPLVSEVSKTPPTWIRIKPQSIAIKKFQYSAVAIDSGIELTLEAVAILSNTTPSVETVSLPKLTVKDTVSDRFSIKLPVLADYDVINAQLSAALAKQPITLPDAGAWVQFTSCQVQSYGAGVLLWIDFSGKKGWFKWVSGHLYVVAKPRFDATTEQLTFEDLAYTADTDSAILNVGNWLAAPLILESLKKQAVIKIGPTMTELKDKANQQFAQLKKSLADQVNAKVELNELSLANLLFATEGPIVVFHADGTMSAELK